MNTRTNADAEAGAAVTDADMDTAGLSEEERAALAPDQDEVDNLGGAVDELENAGGDDDAATAAAEAKAKAEADQKALDDKAEAARVAAEKAEAEAKADAANAEKVEAARAAKEAAEAAATAAAEAKKAGDDAAAKAAEEEAARKAAAAAPADDDEPFVATYTAPPVPDYEKKIEAFTTRLADATAKFKEGTMSLDEFNAERDAVETERRALDAAKIKADIASEQQLQSAEQRWQWEINRFYKRVAKTDGVDYGKSSILTSALDTRVKELANDKANADKDSTWFLEEAHRQVCAELGIGRKQTPGDAAAKAKAEAEAKARAEAERKRAAEQRRPPRKELPKDLGGLPAAAGGEIDTDGEFAELEGLDGMELENALAAMPKAKADRYLAGR